MRTREEKQRDDEEQLEYLRIWQEERDKERAEKLQRRCIRNMHIRFALSYIRAAVEEFILGLKK